MGVLLYCVKGGEGLTKIACCKKQCLNNRHGVCTANDIVYDGRCQTFTTPNDSMRADVNIEAVEYVANSIEKFGFKVPIVVDTNNVIVAGHTRYMASKKLGLETAPCIVADDLTEEQIKAFRLADNKVSEIATWDDELLAIELIDIVDIDMSDFGFVDLSDVVTESDDTYTTDINIPQYEPTGENVALGACLDDSKTESLLMEIENSNLSSEEKDFLRKAAQRHNVFNYKNIANYYANASEEMQELMERSALVIIDYEDAIRNGYVQLSSSLEAILGEDNE